MSVVVKAYRKVTYHLVDTTQDSVGYGHQLVFMEPMLSLRLWETFIFVECIVSARFREPLEISV